MSIAAAARTTMAVSGGPVRSNVLSLYKKCLRLSQTWQATNPSQTIVEKNYIKDETVRLFRGNKSISDTSEIAERVREAEARLTMAEHYRNPYPRPVNLPPGSYSLREGKKLGKAIEKRNKLSKPVYVKSIDDTVKK